MGQFSLFVDMGFDEMPHLVDCLLGLASQAASEGDDMFVDVIDFIGDSVDGVGSSGGSP